eukprot:jgi/Mesvir1/8219/Mv12509-RA.1
MRQSGLMAVVVLLAAVASFQAQGSEASFAHERPEFNDDLSKMSPGCTLWRVNVTSMTLDSGHRGGSFQHKLPLLNFGVSVDADDSFVVSEDHGGIGLGYAGLDLGRYFVIDFSFKNRYTSHGAFPVHYLLSSAGTPPEWTIGFSERNHILQFAHPAKADPNVDFGTGMVRNPGGLFVGVGADEILQWTRVTILSDGYGSLMLYSNGDFLGQVDFTMVAPLLVLGNSAVHNMRGHWGGRLRDVQFCISTRTEEVLADEKVARQRMYDDLRRLRSFDTHWVDALRGKRVVVVGYTPHLAGSQLGAAIDSFQVIIRINSPSQKGNLDMGSSTTHDLLSSLDQLCGCDDGGCCNTYHIKGMATFYQRHGKHVTVVYARDNNIPKVLEHHEKDFFALQHFKPGLQTAQAFNAYLDYLGGPLIKGRRIWHDYHMKPSFIGFRLIMLLLIHGVRPTIVGVMFAESNVLQQQSHAVEIRILKDLIAAGLVFDLQRVKNAHHPMTSISYSLPAWLHGKDFGVPLQGGLNAARG